MASPYHTDDENDEETSSSVGNHVGFVKASTLLLQDAPRDPWYELAIVKCTECLHSKFAGCYCMHDGEHRGHSGEERKEHEVEASPAKEKSYIRRGGMCHREATSRGASNSRDVSMCTIPTLTNNNRRNLLHLQCRTGRCNTMHMVKNGCANCGCHDPEKFRIHRVMTQKSEMQFGVDVFREVLGETIEHTLLRCPSCSAIGFPGSSGRLTVVHHHSGPADAGGESETRTEQRFWCTKTKKSMQPSSWNISFCHFQDCPLKNCTPKGLHLKISKSDLVATNESLLGSVDITKRDEHVKNVQNIRISKKVGWRSLIERLDHGGCDAAEFKHLLSDMIHFCLGVKYELRLKYIFSSSFGDLKKQACNRFKLVKKRLEANGEWLLEHRQKVGTLLRILKAFALEERLIGQIPECDSSAMNEAAGFTNAEKIISRLLDGPLKNTSAPLAVKTTSQTKMLVEERFDNGESGGKATSKTDGAFQEQATK